MELHNNDNALDIEDKVEDGYYGYVYALGFHPYKENVFLSVSLSRAVAYHWNNSRFQDLATYAQRITMKLPAKQHE